VEIDIDYMVMETEIPRSSLYAIGFWRFLDFNYTSIDYKKNMGKAVVESQLYGWERYKENKTLENFDVEEYKEKRKEDEEDDEDHNEEEKN